MKILGIDTSCDETAVSVIEAKNNNFKILSNVVASQIRIHRKYGGVYPTLAKREHQKNLTRVLKKALTEAKVIEKSQAKNSKKENTLKEILKKEKALFKNLSRFLKTHPRAKIDLIAITTGPGLEPCLWQGVNFAKGLSFWWQKPVVGVNHIEGHILANFFENLPAPERIFPAIALVVSGGHTQLVLMKAPGKYKTVGETRDDAAGECFDKTGRLLGLNYPAGPEIARISQKDTGRFKIHLPRPMIRSQDYDFSFSGLKTAVLYEVKRRKKKTRQNPQYIAAMAREIQASIVEVLSEKTMKAAKHYRVKSIMLGGGVGANKSLRETLKNAALKNNFLFFAPPPSLCTDNAAMIALTGYFHKNEKGSWENLKVNARAKI